MWHLFGTSGHSTSDSPGHDCGGDSAVREREQADTVVACSAHSIWADVVWSYDGQPRERFIYQLLSDENGCQVAPGPH